MHGQYDRGATPGVCTPPLTKEPLGTSGELSAGPDHLRPEVPEERAELERMGYLAPRDAPDDVQDVGVMDDASWGADRPPIFEEADRSGIGLPPLFD